MASRKAEMDQLACAPFHIFRGCAVIKDYERVGALKKQAHELQPRFHLVLRKYQDSHSWIIFTNSAEGFVVRECQADEHDVVELAADGVCRSVPPQTRICLNLPVPQSKR